MVETAEQGTPFDATLSRAPPEIAEAKLLRPPTRPGTVHRPVLVDRLIASPTPSLIAIVAPAGYGKTTLLSDWADRDGRPFAWVSVDEGDADPVVFLSHVAVALDRVQELDADVFEAIASPGAANPGRAVRRLGASVSTRAHAFVLVLDELDRAHEPLCMDAVASLARCLPEGSAIAIAARTVPEIGLPRFRADGRLLEIGVDDLSLDAVAARQLLQGAGFRTTKTRRNSSSRRPRAGPSVCTWRGCRASDRCDPGSRRSVSRARTGSSSTTSAPRCWGTCPRSGSDS